GNRAAAGFIAETFQSAGWEVEEQPFDCLDWSQEGAELSVDGEAFPVEISPFSPAASVNAPLSAAGSLEELGSVEAAGKILLVHGELAREQLMPKNFPFYN